MAEALQEAAIDVLVDYTIAIAVKDNVPATIHAGAHVVAGSSGLTAVEYAELDERARSRGVGVIAAGTFSVMATVLRRTAAKAGVVENLLGHRRGDVIASCRGVYPGGV